MKIELLETFLTGHPDIDAEHRQIVEVINAVYDVIRKGDFDKSATLMDEFLNVCIDHFRSEESLLAELDFPGLKAHMVFHNELVFKAKAVKIVCMDMTNPDSVERCFEEMATLLIEDVVKGDLQFASFLAERS